MAGPNLLTSFPGGGAAITMGHTGELMSAAKRDKRLRRRR